MPRTPLTDKHLELLNKVIKSCAETREYLQNCKECNLDVEPEIRRNDEQLKTASLIKAKNFPNVV